MITHRRAIFLVTLLALVGGNLAQAQAVLFTYFFTEQFPSTGLFKAVFSLFWIPLAALAGWCGLRGGYLAVRNDSLRFDSLTVFAILLCPVLKVDHAELGWSIFRLSLYIGLDRLSVGTNFLGLAFLIWLDRLRRAEERQLASSHPTQSTETTRA